jgi:hypothetical protein
VEFLGFVEVDSEAAVEFREELRLVLPEEEEEEEREATPFVFHMPVIIPPPPPRTERTPRVWERPPEVPARVIFDGELEAEGPEREVALKVAIEVPERPTAAVEVERPVRRVEEERPVRRVEVETPKAVVERPVEVVVERPRVVVNRAEAVERPARVERVEVVPRAEPVRPATVVREIAIRLPGIESKPVDVHLVERQGKVQVQVLTDDKQLAAGLRENSEELVERLQGQGYGARIENGWQEIRPAAKEDSSPWQQGQQQQQHPQGQPKGNRARWLQAMYGGESGTDREDEETHGDD